MKKKKKRIHLNLALYCMLIPGFVYLLFNNYIPMTFTVIAFKKFNFQKGIWGSDFIGLDNFKSLFSTRDSWIILRNTVGYNLIFIAVSLFMGLAVAILLDELSSKKGKRLYQMTYLIPYMISITVVSYIVYALLSTGIDSSYYEAATIDGATRFQRIRYITVPLIRSTIITMTLLQLGSIFRSDFGLFYQVPMDSSALMNVTNTIDTYVYRGIKSVGTLGMSSAAGLYQSVVGFVLILVANGIVRKIDKDSAIF